MSTGVARLLRILFVERRLPWRFKYVMQPFVSSTCVRVYGRRYLNFKTMRVADVLPTFLIIGAQKAGTTSLHRYLELHPQIFMSHYKEPGLFLDTDPEVARGHREPLTFNQMLRMMLQGYRGEPVFGESATYYSKAPHDGIEVPEKLTYLKPDMKFIYILRNPIARIVSQYLHYVDRQRVDCDFDEFLETEETHLDRSLYWFQISNYLKYHPADRIRVVIFEEFVRDPSVVLRELCEFLGVDESFSFPDLGVQNPSRSRERIARDTLKFPPAKFEMIADRIRPDVKEMEGFVGRPLDLWDLSAERWC